MYDNTIAIHRLSTDVANRPVGDAGYFGAVVSSTGESVLYTGVACSIQSNAAGRKKSTALPGDVVYAPTWRILIPVSSSIPADAIRDRDIIVDEQGYRYEVGQAYHNFMGWKLTAIRLEA